MARDCEHGQLARSCEICSLSARLRQADDALKKIEAASCAKSYDRHKANGNLDYLIVEIHAAAHIALNQ